MNSHAKPPHRRRWQIWWLPALVCASLLLLVADGAYALVRMGTLLRQTGAHFQTALDAFENAHFMAAQRELRSALETASSARGFADHPGALGASIAPLVGNDAGALRAMSNASELAARAGLGGVRAASALGVAAKELPAAVYRDGRVRFGAIETAGPMIDEVDRLLNFATAELQGAPEPRFELIAGPLATAQDRISDAETYAHKANVLFGSLPSLLAQEGTRRYLLLFQALGEARGTGGVPGIWGVLKASDGRLRLLDIAPIAELQPQPIRSVDAPRWFERAYGSFFALRQWSQANLSPSFPVVSEVFLRMYEAARGDQLDGVIAVDPIALEYLIPATGPLRAPSLDVEVGPDNASDVLLSDAYTGTGGPEAQNAYLEAIVRQFWDRIHEGDVDALALARGLGRSVTTQHFKAYMTDARDQSALRELEADGSFSAEGPNVQMMFHNNVGVNKFDYFLRRAIRTSIEIDSSGTALVKTTISLENQAPPDVSEALGPGLKSDSAGLNAMYLNLLMPVGSKLQGFGVDGDPRKPFRLEEDEFPVAWELLEIPAGSTTEVDVIYSVAHAADLSGDEGLFQFTLWPQATVVPEHYSLEIKLPEGYEATEVEGADSLGGGLVQGSGQLDRPTTVTVELTKP